MLRISWDPVLSWDVFSRTCESNGAGGKMWCFHVLSGVAKFYANQEVTTHLRTVEVSALIAHCVSLQRQNGKIQQTYVVLQCTGILIPDNHLWLRINASVKRWFIDGSIATTRLDSHINKSDGTHYNSAHVCTACCGCFPRRFSAIFNYRRVQ